MSYYLTHDMNKKASPAFVEGKWNVSRFNYLDDALKSVKLPKKVFLSDVTLREGEEAPGMCYSTRDKVLIAQKLDEIGIPLLQVTMLHTYKSRRSQSD